MKLNQSVLDVAPDCHDLLTLQAANNFYRMGTPSYDIAGNNDGIDFDSIDSIESSTEGGIVRVDVRNKSNFHD